MTAVESDSPSKLLSLAVASHYNEQANDHWRRQLARGMVPWSEVTSIARMHGLAPLLYSAVAACSPSGPPIQVTDELLRQYRLTATLNMLAMSDLELILHCLNDRDIPVILLKGAALLLSVYDDQALRPMLDLDILVPYADLGNAQTALAQIGYENSELPPFPNLDGLYWNEILLSDDSRTSAQLELHWNLLDIPYYASRMPVPDLIRRAMPTAVDDQHAFVLSPEDALLHLCAHNLFHHQGSLWRAEVDLAFVAHRFQDKINWDHLISSAVANDLLLGLKRTLGRAADFWHAPIPRSALVAVSGLKPRARESWFARCQGSEFLKILRTLVTLPGPRHRWRYIRGQLLPSRDFVSWRYDVPLSTPSPLAYTRRYASGLNGLYAELAGRNRYEHNKKEPEQLT